MSQSASFDDMRDTLWYLLACQCHKCGAELDLSQWERLRTRDAFAWSRFAADRAIELGWNLLPNAIAVVCHDCQKSP
jgi:hypothetical protein